MKIRAPVRGWRPDFLTSSVRGELVVKTTDAGGTYSRDALWAYLLNAAAPAIARARRVA